MGAPLIPGPAALLRRGKAPVRSTPRIAGSQMAPYSEPNICRSSELLSYTIGSYTQRKIDWQAAKNICCFFYWGLQLLWAFLSDLLKIRSMREFSHLIGKQVRRWHGLGHQSTSALSAQDSAHWLAVFLHCFVEPRNQLKKCILVFPFWQKKLFVFFPLKMVTFVSAQILFNLIFFFLFLSTTSSSTPSALPTLATPPTKCSIDNRDCSCADRFNLIRQKCCCNMN